MAVEGTLALALMQGSGAGGPPSGPTCPEPSWEGWGMSLRAIGRGVVATEGTASGAGRLGPRALHWSEPLTPMALLPVPRDAFPSWTANSWRHDEASCCCSAPSRARRSGCSCHKGTQSWVLRPMAPHLSSPFPHTSAAATACWPPPCTGEPLTRATAAASAWRAPPPPLRPGTRWYVHQPPPHSQAGSVLLWVPTPPGFTLARLSPLPPQIMWAGTPSKDFLVAGDQDLIPGLGSSSGEGNCNPLQYSCLVIPFLDREARQATVRGVAKSWTRLSDSHTQTPSNVRNQLGNYSTSK